MDDTLVVASPYLAVLDGQLTALIAALRGVVTADDISAAHRASARLSVRLDASPLTDATAAAVDRGELSDVPVVADPDDRPASGWAAALRLDGMPTQDIAAIEYRGVRAAQARHRTLAKRFLDAPSATLSLLNGIVVDDLVAPERSGAVRRTSRAVHDGAQGQVIFHAPSPARLPELLARLDAWVRARGRLELSLAVAGLVHHRLLYWQPFEAGNGRVARLASSLALRSRGADPWGLAVPEHTFERHQPRYASEVAATARRGADLRPWNEWTGEAVVGSLEVVARQRGALPPTPDERVVRACADAAAAGSVTVPDIASRTGLGREAVMIELNRLCWAGVLRRDAGTHGLRYAHAEAATDVSDRAGMPQTE